MTPKTFEARCLRLPAVTKVVQWEGTSVFKVGGKMFALGGGFAARSGGYMFKVSNLAYAMLIEHGLARPAPYLARAKWVQLVSNNALPDAELTAYLAQAHALIAAKLTRQIAQGAGAGLTQSIYLTKVRHMLDPVSRVRRFNRAVTSAVGALDTSFLGRGRPLGAARVLNAIGHGRSDVAEIRDYLGLDSGLMSRLLRSLEDDGLIETNAHADDARRRVAKLTRAGRREFAAYEALSNAQAESFLERHAQRDALLAAMDMIASALTRDRVALEEMDPRCEEARHCLGEYYAELGRRFKQGFDVSLSRDPDAKDMRRPRGTFIVAMSDTLPIGCVGLKGTEHGYAEIKRLWVAPAARGLRLGRRLMDAAEDAARELGIKLLRLDTNSALPEAGQLYRTTGWSEIPRFNDDPYPDLFFEKQIR